MFLEAVYHRIIDIIMGNGLKVSVIQYMVSRVWDTVRGAVVERGAGESANVCPPRPQRQPRQPTTCTLRHIKKTNTFRCSYSYRIYMQYRCNIYTGARWIYNKGDFVLSLIKYKLNIAFVPTTLWIYEEFPYYWDITRHLNTQFKALKPTFKADTQTCRFGRWSFWENHCVKRVSLDAFREVYRIEIYDTINTSSAHSIWIFP